LSNGGEFLITCALGIPDPLDMAILVYLLSKAYYLGTDQVHFSLREVSRNLGGGIKTARIKEALVRWGNTVFNFVDSFQTGKGKRTTVSFELFLKNLEYWTPAKKVGKKRAQEVTFVQFNPILMKNIRENKIFAEIDWRFFRSIIWKGIAPRLYLYLTVKLREQDPYRVSLTELAEIIPLSSQRKVKALQAIENALEPMVQEGVLWYQYIESAEIFVFHKGRKKELPYFVELKLAKWLSMDLSHIGIWDNTIKDYLKDPERAIKALVSIVVFYPKDAIAFFRYLYREQNFSTQKIRDELRQIANKRIDYCRRQYVSKKGDPQEFMKRWREEEDQLKAHTKNSPFTYYYVLMRVAEEMAGVKHIPIVPDELAKKSRQSALQSQ